MTVVKTKRKTKQPAGEDVFVVDYSEHRDGPWSPSKLYSTSPAKRRVTFLELMVWAIHHIESFETRDEYEDFLKELVETRELVMASPTRPWANATNDDSFLRHISDIAAVFANLDATATTGVNYPGRKTNPLAESSA
jgi:hypothetical protein